MLLPGPSAPESPLVSPRRTWAGRAPVPWQTAAPAGFSHRPGQRRTCLDPCRRPPPPLRYLTTFRRTNSRTYLGIFCHAYTVGVAAPSAMANSGSPLAGSQITPSVQPAPSQITRAGLPVTHELDTAPASPLPGAVPAVPAGDMHIDRQAGLRVVRRGQAELATGKLAHRPFVRSFELVATSHTPPSGSTYFPPLA